MRNFCKRFLYLVMADGLGWLCVSLLMSFVLYVRLLLDQQQPQVLLWSVDALYSAKPRRDHKVRWGADLAADGKIPLTPVPLSAVQSRCRLPPKYLRIRWMDIWSMDTGGRMVIGLLNTIENTSLPSLMFMMYIHSIHSYSEIIIIFIIKYYFSFLMIFFFFYTKNIINLFIKICIYKVISYISLCEKGIDPKNRLRDVFSIPANNNSVFMAHILKSWTASERLDASWGWPFMYHLHHPLHMLHAVASAMRNANDHIAVCFSSWVESSARRRYFSSIYLNGLFFKLFVVFIMW